MKTKGTILTIIIIIALIGLYASAYVVDETQQVVITEFGKVIGEPKTTPGLKFKVPIIQKATFFKKNILEWDGDPGQIPTLDKTYIWVDTFARWKIVEPVKFFQTVNNEQRALLQLDAIIDPAVRNMITSHRLIETVRMSDRKMDTFEYAVNATENNQKPVYAIKLGRNKIIEGIIKQAKPKLKKFGIELVDVQIKRINYVEEVRQTVYDRMVAERKQIAEKFRSEGKGEAQKILGQKGKDLQKIQSEAYKTVQELKGKADAQAIKIFAQAYGKDPDFYSFTRTLELYPEALDKKTSVILSTDSEFFKYLNGYSEKK